MNSKDYGICHGNMKMIHLSNIFNVFSLDATMANFVYYGKTRLII